MFSSEILLRAFERDLWAGCSTPRRRYREALAADPAAFLQRMKAAWNAKRWVDYQAMAWTSWKAGRLPEPHVPRLGFTLVQARRFGDVLELFECFPWAPEDDARYFRDRSRALAGLGRLDEAAEAVARQLELAPGDDEALDHRRRIERARRLWARLSDPPTWLHAGALIDILFALGWTDGAREVLRRYLDGGSTPAPDELGDMLRAAQLEAACMPAEEAAAFVRRLERVLTGREDLELARATAALIADPAAPEPDATGAPKELRLALALACAAAGRKSQAIGRLGRLAVDHEKDVAPRLPLARLVGEETISEVGVRFRRQAGRRLFDLISFNAEKDLLKIKLAEEAPWVDRFVIVEAGITFSGLPKPFWFERWKDEFAVYADKIIHVKVETFPDWATTAWAREFHQKDMAISGASELWDEDDLVMLTDVDEVVDRRAIEGFDGEFAAMKMDTFRFFLNHHWEVGQQPTGVILRAALLSRFGYSAARNILRSYGLAPAIADAGWHFSNIADAAGLAAKMKSYSHQEYADKDEAYYRRILAKLRGGRRVKDFKRLRIAARFPAYVRQHQDELAEFILPV